MKSMQFAKRLLTSSLVLSLACTPRAFGWGPVGHAVVADIAEAHLTPTAAAEIHRLLAVEGAHHLSDISLWADEAKEQHLAGSPSHTIRLPFDGRAPSAHPCPGHFCADDALVRYGNVLADPKQSDADREIALKYIVHLVGDMQQPLHGTDATGGMMVIFHGKEMSLHAVWDDGILDQRGLTHTQLAKDLMKHEHGVDSSGDAMQWAREDLAIAQKDIYNEVPLKPAAVITLAPGYDSAKWPIVEQRLTQGGLRLAILLNQLLR